MGIELDVSTLLALLALIVTGPLAWVFSNLVQDVKDLRKDLSDQKTHVAENYVEKDDLHRELAEIKGMIKRVHEKLDKR